MGGWSYYFLIKMNGLNSKAAYPFSGSTWKQGCTVQPQCHSIWKATHSSCSAGRGTGLPWQWRCKGTSSCGHSSCRASGGSPDPQMGWNCEEMSHEYQHWHPVQRPVYGRFHYFFQTSTEVLWSNFVAVTKNNNTKYSRFVLLTKYILK